jgi:hypothetical protein
MHILANFTLSNELRTLAKLTNGRKRTAFTEIQNIRDFFPSLLGEYSIYIKIRPISVEF